MVSGPIQPLSLRRILAALAGLCLLAGVAGHGSAATFEEAEIVTKSGVKVFQVEIAVTPAERPAAKIEGEKSSRRPGHRGERSERGGPPGRGPGGFSFRMTGPVVVKLGAELGKLPDDYRVPATDEVLSRIEQLFGPHTAVLR